MIADKAEDNLFNSARIKGLRSKIIQQYSGCN